MNESDLVYLKDHWKYGMQMCPYCHKLFPKDNTKWYKVHYKKTKNRYFDIWKCLNCNRTFELPNKYHINIYLPYELSFIDIYRYEKLKTEDPEFKKKIMELYKQIDTQIESLLEEIKKEKNESQN